MFLENVFLLLEALFKLFLLTNSKNIIIIIHIIIK